jgi:hypothetical protein
MAAPATAIARSPGPYFAAAGPLIIALANSACPALRALPALLNPARTDTMTLPLPTSPLVK